MAGQQLTKRCCFIQRSDTPSLPYAQLEFIRILGWPIRHLFLIFLAA